MMNLDEAVAAICERIQPIEAETVPWPAAAGRVLAEPIRLDRPSPACDVSAMDGYAVRLADLKMGELPVRGEIQAGSLAEAMPAGAAVRIFTGAMVPAGAEAIIPREHVTELSGQIRLSDPPAVEPGQHIRRRGENGQPGRVIAEAGRAIAPPCLGAIASCGRSTVSVYRPVRVGILVTGGEVCPVDATPAPWQLHDSNGPVLFGLLASAAWLRPLPPQHVADEPEAIARAARDMLDQCDALFLTGGVSAGDYDHVPAVLRDLGAHIVFHKLPIRPGKPVLGAADAAGRPIIGLPGNPVSAMVTARRFAAAALRKRAGLVDAEPARQIVQVDGSATAPARLTWFPLVRLAGDGRAALLSGKGSGDWVAAAGSDGFIEVPPGQPATGPRPFYRWSIAD